MKRAFAAFLFLGFVFGFAATTHRSEKNERRGTVIQKAIEENFDFLYGKWELLNAQGIKSRSPASLDDKTLNFVLEDDIYLDSDAVRADANCDSGVEFSRHSKSDHDKFLKKAKSLPLLRAYFADGRRSGIWTGNVLCKRTHQPLWSAVLLTRRQLFLVSGQDVAELYRRESAAPVHESFTDSDSEITSE